MVEISKEEIQGVLHSFKKDKSHGPNGFLVEFFTACFKFVGEYFLKVVEYGQSTGQMLATFNSNFIALIPKRDNPTFFKHFKEISLYNNIYKFIMKIISR
jgi:hypothetical protein